MRDLQQKSLTESNGTCQGRKDQSIYQEYENGNNKYKGVQG